MTTRTTHTQIFQPGHPYVFFVRTSATLSVGVIHAIRGVHSGMIEVIMQLNMFPPACYTYVIFKTCYISATFLGESPAWSVLRETASLSHAELTDIIADWEATLRVRTAPGRPSVTRHLRRRPVPRWALVCAFLQNMPDVVAAPATWAVQYSTELIGCGTTFNLWDAADSSYVLSALVVGVRAVERDVVEFAARIRNGSHTLRHSGPYIYLTAPFRRTDLGDEAERLYDTHRHRLPSILFTSVFHSSA